MSQRLLLDTHVLLWSLSAADRISSRARRAMERPGTKLAASVVSVWEIVMKHQARKLNLRTGLTEFISQILYRSPWAIVPVFAEHLLALAGVPQIHPDPFDRLFIAQALHEKMTIVTADEQFEKYGIRTIW